MRSRIYPRLFFSPLLIRILACHTIFGAPQAPVLRVPAAQMPPAALALPTPWDCGRAKRHTAPLLRRSAPRPNHGARCSAERKSDPGAPKRCGMWKTAPHLKQPVSIVFHFLSIFLCFSVEKQAKNMISTENKSREKQRTNREKNRKHSAPQGRRPWNTRSDLLACGRALGRHVAHGCCKAQTAQGTLDRVQSC